MNYITQIVFDILTWACDYKSLKINDLRLYIVNFSVVLISYSTEKYIFNSSDGGGFGGNVTYTRRFYLIPAKTGWIVLLFQTSDVLWNVYVVLGYVCNLVEIY